MAYNFSNVMNKWKTDPRMQDAAKQYQSDVDRFSKQSWWNEFTNDVYGTNRDRLVRFQQEAPGKYSDFGSDAGKFAQNHLNQNWSRGPRDHMFGISMSRNTKDQLGQTGATLGQIGLAAGAGIAGNAFAGGGLVGSLVGGGAAGGMNAGLTGQNVFKGALGGAALGGAGYGLGQMMGFGGTEGATSGASDTANAGAGSGSMTGTPGSFDVAQAGMSDSPQGLFSETGNHLAQVTEGGTGDYDWLSDMSGNTTLSTRAVSDPNLMGIPINGSYLDGVSLSGDTPEEEIPQDSTLFGEEPVVEPDPTSFEGTSFDSGMDFGAGGEIPVEQQYPGMDTSVMDKLKEAYSMMKDPLALAGAMGKMYMGRNQADEMRKYLESQKASEFNHREFDQLARNYKDPNKRKQMLENTPGYAMSRDYLLKEQMRKLAQQGKFGQIGQGDAMASNWAVPMADVVGKNAMAWDNQIFGQVKDLTGMGENNSAANASLAGAFLPKAASQENQGWMDLLEALRRNQGLLPDVLKTNLF
jgi:hypothetical protein